MADMATRWRRPTARPMVTVAELLDRAAAVSRGSAGTRAVGEHQPGVSVDALLRREGRATQDPDRPAHTHGRRSATPEGGSPGLTLGTAVAVSTLLAAGSVVGVALSSNPAEYELDNTAQPVDAPPVGQSPPTPAGGQNLVPGGQTPVLGAAASTAALAAGSGPSADWTAVAFPPAAGASADVPPAGSGGPSDPTANAPAASGDEASAEDPGPRGDDDTSGSDDDGDDGASSSSSDSRGSRSTPASSTPQDDDVVLAEGGSAEPAPATAEGPIPDGAAPEGAAPEGAAPDGAESGEESGGGAEPVDEPDDQDSGAPAGGDSTEEGPDVVDESGSSTDAESGTDEVAGDSDAESGSSSTDESDGAAEASDGGDGSAGESAA